MDDPLLENGETDYVGLDRRRKAEIKRRDYGVPDVLDSVVNRNTTLELFRALRRQEVEGPLRDGEVAGLETLDVYMGDWGNKEDGCGGFEARDQRIRVAL